jgi:hypothetical protein
MSVAVQRSLVHRANERLISRRVSCLLRVLKAGIAASLVLGCTEALCQDRWPDPMQDWLSKENAWQYSANVGVEFSSGKYGGTMSIDTVTLPLSVSIQKERYFAGLMLPYVFSTGPAVVAELGLNSSQQLVHQKQRGFGDVLLTGGYYLLNRERLALDAAAVVKFPTAERSKGLGTGELDYSGQVDVRGLVKSFIWFGTVGYYVYGDPPGLNLQDVFFGALGVGYQGSGNRTVSISYSTRQAVTATTSAQRMILLSLYQSLPPAYYFNVSGGYGLSDASPDYMLQVSIGRNF